MNFREKYLNDTISTLNVLIEQERTYVDTKTIRRMNQISSDDKTSIQFIWRSLKVLEQNGYIAVDGRLSPVRYEIIATTPINPKSVLDRKDL